MELKLQGGQEKVLFYQQTKHPIREQNAVFPLGTAS